MAATFPLIPGQDSATNSSSDVNRFVGPCLISNRLSNGKGAGRVFPNANRGLRPVSYLAPEAGAPFLTTLTGAPLISWRSAGAAQQKRNSFYPQPLLQCGCGGGVGSGVCCGSMDLASMGVGLIAVESGKKLEERSSPLVTAHPSLERESSSDIGTSWSSTCSQESVSSVTGIKKQKAKKNRTQETCSMDNSQRAQSFCPPLMSHNQQISISSPPSYCYLSITKDKSYTKIPSESCNGSKTDVREWSGSNKKHSLQRTGSLPPLITIAVPPNCHFIRDDDSVQLSTSYDSAASVSSSCEDDTCSLFSDKDDFPALISPYSSDSGQVDDSASESGGEDLVNTAPPPDRQWIICNRLERDRPIATFSVMCYNVLCDKYASTSVYTYCPSWALNWEYRKKLIMQEIRNYESDIIALQEVETGQYKHLFKPELEQLGYAGIFSPKSRAKTMGAEEKKYVDGCALFWKMDKFELEEEKLIEFTQLAIAKAEGSDEMLNRVMTRDNIAIAAVLKFKEPVYGGNMHHVNPVENVVGGPIVVCAAHIHWDPEFCDVKLVQTMMLVQELSKLLEDVGRQHRINPAQVPLLTCGDLNSLPNSGVFEYLTRGKISADHMDFKGFRGQKESVCLQKLSSTTESHVYTHPLKLESACDASIIPFSNYTLDFKGMIDYVFATPISLYKLAVLGSLDHQWFNDNKIIGFPHPHIPSDHLPLVAQYAVIPPNHQRLYQNQQAFQHYPGPVGHRPT